MMISPDDERGLKAGDLDIDASDWRATASEKELQRSGLRHKKKRIGNDVNHHYRVKRTKHMGFVARKVQIFVSPGDAILKRRPDGQPQDAGANSKSQWSNPVTAKRITVTGKSFSSKYLLYGHFKRDDG